MKRMVEYRKAIGISRLHSLEPVLLWIWDCASLPWPNTKLLLTLGHFIQQSCYDSYECITKHDERGDWSQHISQEKIILSGGKEKSD